MGGEFGVTPGAHIPEPYSIRAQRSPFVAPVNALTSANESTRDGGDIEGRLRLMLLSCPVPAELLARIERALEPMDRTAADPGVSR